MARAHRNLHVSYLAGAAALMMSTAAVAENAPHNGTVGYMLTGFVWATYQTPSGKDECPEGLNFGLREEIKAQFPNATIGKLAPGGLTLEQIEIRKVARQEWRIGEPGEAVLGRDPRHGDRALRKLVDVALDIVGRHHGLAVPDQDPKSDIVALGALGGLHLAVAHLDRRRHGTNRNRVGRISAGAPRRSHQTLGKVGERGLIEQGGCHEGFPWRVSWRLSCLWLASISNGLRNLGKLPSSMSSITAADTAD